MEASSSLIETTAWSYDSYKTPSSDRLEIVGQHKTKGHLVQVFHYHSVVNADTGERVSDETVAESNWDFDNYEITDETELRVPGSHPVLGDVTQAFRLARIKNEEGDTVEEF